MPREKKLLALVVDDEVAIRRLVSLALQKQGFDVDIAVDGEDAEQKISERTYEAVITDLRMPKKHGHSLAATLLQSPSRPVLVIHTGVLEPRLAKDLLARGVDDIVFKPADFGVLATKVRLLVDRRATRTTQEVGRGSDSEEAAGEGLEGDVVSLHLLQRKLGGFLRLLPISQTALEVYAVSNSDSWDTGRIAAMIQRDAALATEILRLANSSFYNTGGGPIGSLERAVTLIGQRKIGELALAASALSALTPGLLPWLDLELTWKRSVAAGIALELILQVGGHRRLEKGLHLSTAMHPMGRVALGTLFPRQYELMTRRCLQQGDTLQEHERRVFPLRDTEVLAHILSTWNIPVEAYEPLKFSADDDQSVARLSEPLRTKVELVKLAAFVGQVAAGRWENWDLVHIPSENVLQRLKIPNLPEIIENTRLELEQWSAARSQRPARSPAAPSTVASRQAAYCHLAERNADLFPALLPAFGLQVFPCRPDQLSEIDLPLIVNCLGCEATQFAARRPTNARTIVLCEPDRHEIFSRFVPAIIVPNSFSRLRAALLAITEPTSVKPS